MRIRKFIIIIILSIFLAIILWLIHGGTFSTISKLSKNSNRYNDISVSLEIHKGIYSKNNYTLGFCYEIIKKFCNEKKINLNIHQYMSTAECWKDFYDKKIDIVTFNIKDSISSIESSKSYFSIPIKDTNYFFALNDLELLKELNFWLGAYKQSKEYKHLYTRFFLQQNSISPYDNIIKKYSKKLGWDWKLLAAIIYKESRFSICAYSNRGAEGLMQILPSTANQYSNNNFFDPDENIKLGTKHLSFLQKLFINNGVNEDNLKYFVLASYNAGYGRILECRRFTEKLGKDKNNWEDVKESIKLMKVPKYYQDSTYKIKKFKGNETVDYVDNILEIYHSFSNK